jgi:hypothetical protein
MDISLGIWSAAILVYGMFLAWHQNWRGPLTPQEIDYYLKRLEERATMPPATRAVIEEFMRRDTGRAFLMVNLIKFPDGTVPHPDTREPVKPQELLLSYFRPFMKQIIGRAGYPAYQGVVRAGYIEAWGVEENPGWQFAGLIRYRSRRDAIEIILNPAFDAVHGYKRQAIIATMALPVETRGGLLFSPLVWVAMALIGLAAVAHLATLII